jgi:DNA-binding response OmpR family regulator
MKRVCAIQSILFITENNDDLILLQLALHKTPFIVNLKHSFTSERILSLLNRQAPDLLFIDINHPGYSSIYGISAIRKSKNFNNLPVIVYTTSEKQEHINECYSNGANFYFIKPYTIRNFVEELTMLLTIDWKSSLYIPPRSEFVIGK